MLEPVTPEDDDASPDPAMPLLARTMIVTGASSGIGRALAIAAARDGYRVVLVARRAERLDACAAEIRAAGGACATLAVDVRAPDAPARIVAAAIQAFQHIDVVVNNAGGGAYGELLAQSDADIEAQWQLHVAAPLRIARAALPHLERSHGQLVFIGSGLARVPLPKYGAYAPVKAAVRAAATQLRRELRDRGIAVTYVDPGLVATEFHTAMGVERSSNVKAADPQRVAAAILRGIARRAATVNAVPLQTFGTILGEWFSTLADPATSRMAPTPAAAPAPPYRGERVELCHAAQPMDGPVPVQRRMRDRTGEPVEAPLQPPAPEAPPPPTSFEAALEPVARRMERVKLSPTFVREALVPGATLELNEVAMRWAGMPNKNERAAMHEVLEALAAGGYLESIGVEQWKVVRAAE